MKEKGEIKSVSSTTVQGGVEMYTYWYKAPDGIYRTQASFRITTRCQRVVGAILNDSLWRFPIVFPL